MSEPYDVTRPADADAGLRRFVDRTGREWTEPDPDVAWWEGPTECDVCGYGTDGKVRSVMPVPRDHPHPLVPMQCGRCLGMTLHPVLSSEG